jgi:hypothetical protein
LATHVLDSVTIDGFRGLRKLELNGLGQINVLLGGNNSGKTSVLEAISVILNAFKPYEWLSLVQRRDYGRLDESRIQSLKWCLNQSSKLSNSEEVLESSCSLSCHGKFLIPRLKVTMNELVGEPPLPTKVGIIKDTSNEQEGITDQRHGIKITHEIVGLKTMAFLPQSIFKSSNYLKESDYLRELVVWEDELFKEVVNGDHGPSVETLSPYSYQLNLLQTRRITEYLQEEFLQLTPLLQLFDTNITNLGIGSTYGRRPSVYLVHKVLGHAPLSTFGDALRRVVLIATTLGKVRDGVLLIDEVEAGYHVGTLKKVFSWLVTAAQKLNVQVIMTTHSLEALDAMLDASEAVKSELVAYHLEQDAEKTKAERFSENLLLRLRRERGLDVR